MSTNPAVKLEIDLKNGEFLYKKGEEKTFKYGCKWGCGR